jgi:hypothetical protein
MLTGSSRIAAIRLPNHLKDFKKGWSTPGKGCADATFSMKMALETLREQDQVS